MSPVAAETALRMQFAVSFDQRSPHRLVVTRALSAARSISATSATRAVARPCGSPIRNTVCRSPPRGTARRTWPGSKSSTEMTLAMHPTVRPQPTTPATVSSLMQFWSETTNPSGARKGAIIVVDHAVS